MHIEWRSARNQLLEVLVDEGDSYVRALCRPLDLGPILAGIDFYKSTRITPDEFLIRDFLRARATQDDPALSAYLSRLLSLANAAIAVPGSYLVFEGD